MSSRYRFRKKGYKSPPSSPYPNRTPGRGMIDSQIDSTKIRNEDCLESTSLHQQCGNFSFRTFHFSDAISIDSVRRADLSRHNKKHSSNAPLSAFRSKYKIHYKKPILVQKGWDNISLKGKQSHYTFQQRSRNPAARTISPYK